MRAAMICLAAVIASSAAGLHMPSADPSSTTRRLVIANVVGGATALTLPGQDALAACFGKCNDPDLERRTAERLAIQTGTSSKSVAKEEPGATFSTGLDGLIERSIRNEELALGQKLSEESKAQIAAKVRRLAPSDKVSAASRALPTLGHLHRAHLLSDAMLTCSPPWLRHVPGVQESPRKKKKGKFD